MSRELLDACDELSRSLAPLRFAPPVAHVYDPLDYARAPYQCYVRRFADGPRRVVFLGMNPGPYGMMQTGVPFGEVAAVRDWMHLQAPVLRPAAEHPKRLITGFDCPRSEVSGRRLWGWAARRFGSAENFFAEAFVLNFCPLVFLEESGRNRTPEQLPSAERRPVDAACERHLVRALRALQPQWAIGIGGFATRRLMQALRQLPQQRLPSVATVLHPSPASPAANRGWEAAMEKQLRECGLSDWLDGHLPRV